MKDIEILEQEIFTPELVAIRAMNWLESNLSQFNPFSFSEQADEFSQTALAELAMLCHQINRRPDLICNSRVNLFNNSCLDTVENVYQIPQFYQYIFSGNKYAFIAHLIIWLTLIERNIEEIVSQDQLQWLIDNANVAAIERIPFRMLELSYFLELGKFRHYLSTETELFHQTILGSQFQLISLMDSDIYSITHTIFYLTDFGLKHSQLLAKKDENLILTLIENLIGMMIYAKHWDLVAELILAYRCLSTAENYWITLAWKGLESVQTSTGMIYNFQAQTTLEKTTEEIIFRGYYHRTLVTVMAGLLGKRK